MTEVENKKFANDLEKRTRNFTVSIIRLSATLPNTVEGKVVRSQITRSASSIGANYREANRARSKADFRNKIRICETEASETKYWLEIILEMKWKIEKQIQTNFNECKELLALFTSIINTLNNKSSRLYHKGSIF